MEVELIHIDQKNQTLPTYKYFIDYSEPHETKIILPSLNDITASWFKDLLNSNLSKLPLIENTIIAHKLLFNWLENNNSIGKSFPIT